MPRPRKYTKQDQYVRGAYEMRSDHDNFIDQQLEAEKMSNIWTTARIAQAIKDAESSDKADLSFAFHGMLEWKNGNIRFEYTEEEWQELDRCLDDPEYFIETYCNFMTDYGRIKVKLRKYQRELIHLMGDEHYDEKYDLMVPDNRNVLIMQSRQTG